ncbi:MAG: hypothetical protein HY235_06425 [Acidobacteria bacterium]|nr:hypothetical protein [Acidobacteriota bacterium]
MAAGREATIAEKFREGKQIDRALVKAVREAIRMHKRLGQPIATLRDGEVVLIPPEEIPEPPADE